MRRQGSPPGPRRPASASVVRIGTEKVRSRPYRRTIAALSPAQVNDALRKYLDPAKLSLVMAGDFKK